MEPLWLEAEWSQEKTYYQALPKPKQSRSESEWTSSLLLPYFHLDFVASHTLTIEGNALELEAAQLPVCLISAQVGQGSCFAEVSPPVTTH